MAEDPRVVVVREALRSCQMPSVDFAVARERANVLRDFESLAADAARAQARPGQARTGSLPPRRTSRPAHRRGCLRGLRGSRSRDEEPDGDPDERRRERDGALLRSGISTDQLEAHIPFLGVLLKKEQDVDALVRFDGQGGKFPARWADLGPRYNQ